MTGDAELRVGDAERDAVVAALTQHFVEGRLTAVEREERTELALRARTRRDLDVLLADLPGPGGQRRAAPAVRRPPVPLLAALVLAVVLAFAVLHVVPFVLIGVLVLLSRGRRHRPPRRMLPR